MVASVWEVRQGPSGPQLLTVRTNPCWVCKQPSTIQDVDPVAYWAWKRGALIQIAFPEWSREQRELLKTGIHAECWNKMFAEDEK